MVLPLFDQNPTREKPIVTRWLIGMNIAVFLLTWWLEAHGVTWVATGYGMVPSRISADLPGEFTKVFTSMFLHADWTHLGLNLLYLHIFGDNVEDALGKPRYLGFYFLCGIAAAAAQYMMDPTSVIPMVGASGAIAGVLGAYMVFYPRAPVIVFNPLIIPLPILPFPSWLVIGWWFFLNILGELFDSGAGVAYLAHIGGFLTGLFAARTFVQMGGREHGAPVDDELFQSTRRVEKRQVQSPIFRKDDDAPFWR